MKVGTTENVLPGGKEKPGKVVEKELGTPPAEDLAVKPSVKPSVEPAVVTAQPVVKVSEKDQGTVGPKVATMASTKSVQAKPEAPRPIAVKKTAAPSVDPKEEEDRLEALLRRVVLPAISQAVSPVVKEVETLKALMEKQVLRLDALEREAKDQKGQVARVKTSVNGCVEQLISVARLAIELKESSQVQFGELSSLVQSLRTDIASMKESMKPPARVEPEEHVGWLPQTAAFNGELGENDRDHVRSHRRTVSYAERDGDEEDQEAARSRRREERARRKAQEAQDAGYKSHRSSKSGSRSGKRSTTSSSGGVPRGWFS